MSSNRWSSIAARATIAAVLAALATTVPAEADYELVAQWASDSPEALDVDGRGSVYVASAAASNNHVTRYTTNGRVVATWGSHGREPGQFEHVYRSGRIAVKLSCRATTTCRGTLRIAKGKSTIGTRSYRIKAGKRTTVRLEPTRRGRATLRRSRTHRVTVQLRQRNGNTVSRTLTLRR